MSCSHMVICKYRIRRPRFNPGISYLFSVPSKYSGSLKEEAWASLGGWQPLSGKGHTIVRRVDPGVSGLCVSGRMERDSQAGVAHRWLLTLPVLTVLKPQKERE